MRYWITDTLVFGIIIIGLFLLMIGESNAATVEAKFELPTTREGGGPLPIDEISHTIFKWQCPTGSGQRSIQAPATSDVFDVELIGQCSFVAAVVDITELQSDWSEPFFINLPADSKPNAPVVIEIIVKVKVVQ